MNYATATQCSPPPSLGSILRASPQPALGRVRYAAQLLFGDDMDRFAVRLGVGRQHLYRVISGERLSDALRGRIAQILGVAVEDIWPLARVRDSRL